MSLPSPPRLRVWYGYCAHASDADLDVPSMWDLAAVTILLALRWLLAAPSKISILSGVNQGSMSRGAHRILLLAVISRTAAWGLIPSLRPTYVRRAPGRSPTTLSGWLDSLWGGADGGAADGVRTLKPEVRACVCRGPKPTHLIQFPPRPYVSRTPLSAWNLTNV